MTDKTYQLALTERDVSALVLLLAREVADDFSALAGYDRLPQEAARVLGLIRRDEKARYQAELSRVREGMSGDLKRRDDERTFPDEFGRPLRVPGVWLCGDPSDDGDETYVYPDPTPSAKPPAR